MQTFATTTGPLTPWIETRLWHLDQWYRTVRSCETLSAWCDLKCQRIRIVVRVWQLGDIRNWFTSSTSIQTNTHDVGMLDTEPGYKMLRNKTNTRFESYRLIYTKSKQKFIGEIFGCLNSMITMITITIPHSGYLLLAQRRRRKKWN